MQPPSHQELNRIAASIRLTGELLEANGTRALTATASWSSGPRSANLDPDAGGWQYEIIDGPHGPETAPVPNDSTGEQAMRGDPYDATTRRLVSLVLMADKVNHELRKLLYAACPQNTMPDQFEPDTPVQISAAGWCVSCHRDGGYCEPVSMRPDGTRRYRDYCTWCGTYVAEARKQTTTKTKGKKKKTQTEQALWPPIALIEARHRGRRITQQMVDNAMRPKAKAS